MRALGMLAALIASPVAAQVSYPPVDSVIVAQAASADAKASDAMALAAAACMPMAATPPIEVPGGTTGSGTNCRLVNSADNRISRVGVFTVAANGAITCAGSTTCVWSLALPAGAASYPMFFTAIGATATPSIRCKVVTSTNTGFSANCTQAVAAVSILGASVEVPALSGTQVYALALPSTQASQ